MLSTFVRLAQQRMVEKGMSAQEACNTLRYKVSGKKNRGYSASSALSILML